MTTANIPKQLDTEGTNPQLWRRCLHDHPFEFSYIVGISVIYRLFLSFIVIPGAFLFALFIDQAIQNGITDVITALVNATPSITLSEHANPALPWYVFRSD